MSIEAMKLALEALELFCECGTMDRPIERREALRQAIEQAQKQEPVACYEGNEDIIRYKDIPIGAMLYTSPPQRQPLTRGQIREIEVDVSLNPSFDYITPAEQLCRAIEAAHGIKGEA